jgi:NADH-quinone oxidoreductase subunit H
MGQFFTDLWTNLPHLFTWLWEGVLRYNMTQWGWPTWVIDAVLALIGVIVVSSFGLVLVIFTIWLERKVAARFQDRLGPNRVGPLGLLQTVADAIKLMTKEDITPRGADVFLFNVAPFLAVISVLLLWAVIPFTSDAVGTNVNIGVIYLVAIGSLGTLAILIAGWSSNNKYALLGAFRTVAQLVGYEVPMILALLVPVMLARTMAVNSIVQEQVVWYIVLSPIAALTFFISSVAEVGRTPFDLLEAESEIVAGFHIEYTGMKFGLFFLAEFLHAFTISAMTAVLFLGGWRGPWSDQYPILGLFYFMFKTFAVYFVVMWIRSTLPRIRIDHMHAFNWKFLVPVALSNLIVTALADKLPWSAIPTITNAAGRLVTNPDWVAHLPRAATLLAGNLLVIAVALLALRWAADRERRAAEPSAPAAVHAGEHVGAHEVGG